MVIFISLLGPSKITSMNISHKVGTGGWGIASGSEAYHASSDVSLFSTSLPVLPHGKSMYHLFFEDSADQYA